MRTMFPFAVLATLPLLACLGPAKDGAEHPTRGAGDTGVAGDCETGDDDAEDEDPGPSDNEEPPPEDGEDGENDEEPDDDSDPPEDDPQETEEDQPEEEPSDPDAPRTYTTIECARNGSEICDDQVFDVPAAHLQPVLVCRGATRGIAYISSNTGPEMSDGMERCQGWEERGEDAWDHLDYVVSFVCEYDGQTLDVDLSAWDGGYLWMGSHDNPDGGGHMNDVCMATWD